MKVNGLWRYVHAIDQYGQGIDVLVSPGRDWATVRRLFQELRPQTATIFFGTWRLGALLLSMSVLYRRGDPPPLDDSSAAVLVTNAENAQRFVHGKVLQVEGLFDGYPTEHPTADTAADRLEHPAVAEAAAALLGRRDRDRHHLAGGAGVRSAGR